MALQKEKGVFGDQIQAGYWKSVQEIADKRAMTLSVVLNLFMDKSSSDRMAPPLDQMSFVCECSKEELLGNRTELAYVKAKSLIDFFSDALDA